MAKFYIDASEMTLEELETTKREAQFMANYYHTIIKVATATGELIFREEINPYIPDIAKINRK